MLSLHCPAARVWMSPATSIALFTAWMPQLALWALWDKFHGMFHPHRPREQRGISAAGSPGVASGSCTSYPFCSKQVPQSKHIGWIDKIHLAPVGMNEIIFPMMTIHRISSHNCLMQLARKCHQTSKPIGTCCYNHS